jgi:CDGSH-type Zn-finger protein/uncharacterized Fe-S cluster protein YjdI
MRSSDVAGHHTARFDIDEDALEIGVDVVVETVRSLAWASIPHRVRRTGYTRVAPIHTNMEQEVHEYDGEDITVSYDVKRCIHARECVRGLPAVFDPDERPWIDPDAADADALAEVITRCPTGALHFERKDGGWEETVPDENVIEVVADGPLYARGDVEIVDDGETLLTDTRVAFCRCGASGNKPLCDNSHLDVDFDASGTVTGESTNEDPATGRLRVTPTANGPLHVEGEFEIDGRDDGSIRGDDAWLCRCGASANKPFCDGTHAEIGFTTEDD